MFKWIFKRNKTKVDGKKNYTIIIFEGYWVNIKTFAIHRKYLHFSPKLYSHSFNIITSNVSTYMKYFIQT